MSGFVTCRHKSKCGTTWQSERAVAPFPNCGRHMDALQHMEKYCGSGNQQSNVKSFMEHMWCNAHRLSSKEKKHQLRILWLTE